MTRIQLDDHTNLILLCKLHHKEVDDNPKRYTIEELRRIKREHRAWIASLGEDDRRPARQAEKITAWPSVVRSNPSVPDSPPAWGATIRNGSELPVYQVQVEFVPIERGRGGMAVVIEVIPPGDWHISGRKVYPKPELAELKPDVWGMPERTYVIELRFTDTNGHAWRRSHHGLLSPVP
jgi:hypothetical protein